MKKNHKSRKANSYLGPLSRTSGRSTVRSPASVSAVPVRGLVVDASCVAKSSVKVTDGYFHGKVEWQCRCIESGITIFKSPVRPYGTINIAEYLAIVDALSLLFQNGMHDVPVYSDSITAITWVNRRLTASKLKRNADTVPLLVLMEKAQVWLQNNKPLNPVLKWDTEMWGENPADYGRK